MLSFAMNEWKHKKKKKYRERWVRAEEAGIAGNNRIKILIYNSAAVHRSVEWLASAHSLPCFSLFCTK